ncbi:MAG: kelch repeat-containing protein [Patescibacteria group bacterium]
MKKYPKSSITLGVLVIILLTIILLKIVFNIPPSDNSAATVLSQTQIKTTTQKVFLLGGTNDSLTPLEFNDVYSSVDGKNWKLISPQDNLSTTKWSPRKYFGSNTVYFNNKIWVIGGVGSSNASGVSEVWSSPDGISWNLVTNTAPKACDHNVVVFNNKMWMISSTGNQTQNNWYCGNTPLYPTQSQIYYSSDGISWTATNISPWGYLDYSSAVVFQNKIWVMGGIGYNSIYSRKTIWSSPDGITWTHVDTNPTLAGIQDAPWEARDSHTSLVFNNKIWIFGGRGANGSIYNGVLNNDIWSSPDGINWTLVLSNPPWSTQYQYVGGPSFKGSLFGHSSFVLNGKMFIVHGEEPSQSCNISGCTGLYGQIWSSPDGINWTKVIPTGDSIAPRYGLSTVVVPVSDLQK